MRLSVQSVELLEIFNRRMISTYSTNRIVPLLLILLAGSSLLLGAVVKVGAQTGDFVVSVSPSRETIGADGIGRYSIRLTSVNGFTGVIQLQLSGIPTSSNFQTSYSFEPSIVELAADSEAYSVLTLAVSSNYGYGNYPYTSDTNNPSSYNYNLYTMRLSVVATSSGTTKDAPVVADIFYAYSLNRPDLTIDLQPGNILLSGSLSKTVNQTLTIRVTASSVQGGGTYLFTATPQFYDPPGGIYVSFSPTSAQVSTGETIQFLANILMTPEFLVKSGTYRLAIGISSPSPYGSYRNVVLSKIAIITVVVPPSFSVTTNPAILNVYIGGEDQKMQVIVTPVTRGISQPILLHVEGVPQGLVATFEQDTLIPKGTAPAYTNLVFSAPSTYESKIYPIQIFAETTGITRIANASIYVQSLGDYQVTLQQTTIALNARGDSKSTTMIISPSGGFRSTIYYSVSQLPAGVTATFSSSSSTVQADQPITVVLTLTADRNAVPGSYNVAILCSTGLSSKTVIVTLLIRSGIYEIWPIILIVVAIIAAVTIVVFLGIPRRKALYVLKEDEKRLLP